MLGEADQMSDDHTKQCVTKFEMDWNRLRSGDYRAIDDEHQDVFDMIAAKDAEIERLRGLLMEVWNWAIGGPTGVSSDLFERVREALGK